MTRIKNFVLPNIGTVIAVVTLMIGNFTCNAYASQKAFEKHVNEANQRFEKIESVSSSIESRLSRIEGKLDVVLTRVK